MSRSRPARSALLPGAALLLATAIAGACGQGRPDAADGATLTVIATDVAFDSPTYTVAAGAVEVTLVQEGLIPHTLVIGDEDGNELDLALAVNDGRPEATATIDIEAGGYLIWCTIPGHRALGQEAILTAS